MSGGETVRGGGGDCQEGILSGGGTVRRVDCLEGSLSGGETYRKGDGQEGRLSGGEIV